MVEYVNYRELNIKDIYIIFNNAYIKYIIYIIYIMYILYVLYISSEMLL